ncbi:hypothetical protein XENOCAPTIV_010833 [Xenoophorus captivus]|uniref:Uncharacterized protein n=1 Tax=Xenoophorus captivus TaxID=1517983 RepID=A0ABV0RQ06_9TELE
MIVQRQILHKTMTIMENPEHSLHENVVQQQSVFSQRLLQIHCNTDLYRRSLLPAAINIYSGSLKLQSSILFSSFPEAAVIFPTCPPLFALYTSDSQLNEVLLKRIVISAGMGEIYCQKSRAHIFNLRAGFHSACTQTE